MELRDHFIRASKQGFIPIFVEDGRDSKAQVEACVAAGMTTIEYTLRKNDAHEMIPWIRKNFPDLTLLVGSTLDSEKIVKGMRHKHPQLRTVEELVDMDVHGFVSMMGWKAESIQKYSQTHLLAPLASTTSEALFMTDAGVHWNKMNGPDLSLIRRSRLDASFGYCPIFVTGGMTTELIPSAIEAGGVCIGSGFDLMLKEMGTNLSVEEMSGILKTHLQCVHDARKLKHPELYDADNDEAFLKALPHYHPFI